MNGPHEECFLCPCSAATNASLALHSPPRSLPSSAIPPPSILLPSHVALISSALSSPLPMRLPAPSSPPPSRPRSERRCLGDPRCTALDDSNRSADSNRSPHYTSALILPSSSVSAPVDVDVAAHARTFRKHAARTAATCSGSGSATSLFLSLSPRRLTSAEG